MARITARTGPEAIPSRDKFSFVIPADKRTMRTCGSGVENTPSLSKAGRTLLAKLKDEK